MYNTIKERLTAYLEFKKISKSEFGRMIGVSNAFVTSLKKSIAPDKLQRIKAEFPDLNLEWLQFGTGEMLCKSDEEQKPGHLKFTVDTDVLLEALRESQAQTTTSQSQISKCQEQIDRLITIISAFQK